MIACKYILFIVINDVKKVKNVKKEIGSAGYIQVYSY